jgi:hypothetical protein
MKMEQCYETSAFKLQTPANLPEERIYQTENTSKQNMIDSVHLSHFQIYHSLIHVTILSYTAYAPDVIKQTE